MKAMFTVHLLGGTAMAKKPTNHRKPWTRTEDQQLRAMARENTPTRVAALKVGRTPTAVYARAAEIGVSLKPTNQRPNKGRRKR